MKVNIDVMYKAHHGWKVEQPKLPPNEVFGAHSNVYKTDQYALPEAQTLERRIFSELFVLVSCFSFLFSQSIPDLKKLVWVQPNIKHFLPHISVRPSDCSTRTTTSTSFPYWARALGLEGENFRSARAQNLKLVLVVVLVLQSKCCARFKSLLTFHWKK